MMRLIDADALKKSILHSLGINSEIYLIFGSEKKIWKLINDAPTIEPDSDTISRQKVISTINVLRTRCDTDDIDDYHDLLVEAIEVLPPSPSRPHGHWKIIFKGTIAEGLACSECGKRGYGENLTNFCPNCGANMREEND